MFCRRVGMTKLVSHTPGWADTPSGVRETRPRSAKNCYLYLGCSSPHGLLDVCMRRSHNVFQGALVLSDEPFGVKE